MRHVQGFLGSHWSLPLGDYLLHIAPAAARATGKQTTINKYTYFAGHFDGHGHAPVRYRAHCQMEEVQGFTPPPKNVEQNILEYVDDRKKGTIFFKLPTC
jgi:hypothetical protein